MLKMLKKLFPMALVLSLFLLLMVACDDDDDSDINTPEPTPTEEATSEEPATEEPATEEPEDSEDTEAEAPEDTTTAQPTPLPPAEEPVPAPEPSAPSIDDTCILWKPVSEGDHNLVILLPANYGNEMVNILDAAGTRLETGRSVGRTNGNRPTYRFSRPGHGYPDPAYLEVGGSLYKVNNPGIRHSC